ncbi:MULTISPECIES: hypothetical protein [Pseudoalteromonas]|uniref:Uncharacterized protein n=1 Tax=Pseudoalteromonas obscura TaxID=3048491 RepID=A0ABT7ET09_9GAMM|nr:MULTISPECIES: hypothetical protein [Pseudoalteromonas]MBQ4839331.1 hypothetical protein [Pseudoalteromonas luteoviolacea]MDK2598172.1 hypothetical protein [Pseudoalteromonas sp. P94(2023)]
MTNLVFRSCVASDGRKIALLSDQLDVEEKFDNGYKIAYKDKDGKDTPELLAKWKDAYTVHSRAFSMLPEGDEIPPSVQQGFNTMVSSLLKGVDILFCDYNLGVEGDLPMCNDVMDKHRSTDFVLFSCDSLVGGDPKVQPHTVAYSAPRYEQGEQIAQQHRIYCKTEASAFCQAINAIVTQRSKDNLIGGHIRDDIDAYIGEPAIDQEAADQILNRFVETLQSHGNQTPALTHQDTE